MRKERILIKCNLLKSNHLYCNMQINNIEGYFIIDTGASNSCVGFKHKDFFKLEKFVKSYSASGAGSEKFDAYKTKKAFVSHNGNKIEKINFLLIEMDSINKALNQNEDITIHGIIGADILKKKKALINYSNLELIF